VPDRKRAHGEMSFNKPFDLKRLQLCLLFLLFALIAALIIFLGLASFWVGLKHAHRDGFWMPVLIGILLLGLPLYWLFLLSRTILKKIREDDLMNY
jgi:uncharacterized membrane protein HdeD (DUF308 family)